MPLYHRTWVLEARTEGSVLNVVELVAESTFILYAINLEAAVWRIVSPHSFQTRAKQRHVQIWLNRAEIGSEDLRMLLREIDCLDAGPSRQI